MSTRVTRVEERVLRHEFGGPAFVTKVGERTLIQTEGPADLKAALVTHVVKSALIQEFAGIQGVGKVHESTLVQVQAPPPFDAPFINGARMSVLTEDPSKSFVTDVHENALLLVEGPIVEQRAMKVTHATLTIDLERGVTASMKVTSSAMLLTEAPTRDPYRTKVASVLHASQTNLYADPLTVIAKYRFQAFSTMSGLPVLYPERSVSPIRVPSAVSQTAISVNGKPLNEYRSYTNVPQITTFTGVKVAKVNPIGMQSPTRGYQVEIKSASATTLPDPLTILASFRFPQISTIVGNRTAYQELSGIHSYVRTLSTNAMTVCATEYPVPPTSQMRVNAIKTEAATSVTQFLEPTDPRLASNESVYQSFTQVATHNLSLVNPVELKSTQTALRISLDTGTPTTYGDPTGFIPGGRQYQTGLQIVTESPDYGTFPMSSTYVRHFETQAALGGLNMRDPILYKDMRLTTQVYVTVAIPTNLYNHPDDQKTKRRSSSTQVGRKPA